MFRHRTSIKRVYRIASKVKERKGMDGTRLGPKKLVIKETLPITAMG